MKLLCYWLQACSHTTQTEDHDHRHWPKRQTHQQPLLMEALGVGYFDIASFAVSSLPTPQSSLRSDYLLTQTAGHKPAMCAVSGCRLPKCITKALEGPRVRHVCAESRSPNGSMAHRLFGKEGGAGGKGESEEGGLRGGQNGSRSFEEVAHTQSLQPSGKGKQGAKKGEGEGGRLQAEGAEPRQCKVGERKGGK